jgi:hypothetical protein
MKVVTYKTSWSEQDWKFIVQDAKCAKENVPMLRRMGARATRRWAKQAVELAQREQQLKAGV